ncbi:MAG: glutaredoxin 3 [Endozoicomonadaceae bacterium]|nr:glutaredoxin 3 [Endozoicomonadaceae bacterium]
MQKITIYSSDYCPFCQRALALLDSKGATYRKVNVDGQAAVRQAMVERAGRTSVPQIWIGETHVGGYDDLYALDAAGKLDELLTS